MSKESLNWIREIIDLQISICADDASGRTYKTACQNIWNLIEAARGDASTRKDEGLSQDDAVQTSPASPPDHPHPQFCIHGNYIGNGEQCQKCLPFSDTLIGAIEAEIDAKKHPPLHPGATQFIRADVAKGIVRRHLERESGELERARLALTPSSVTKAALIGEFSMQFPERDENGNDVMRTINVPWTTIKEIMNAIRKMAFAEIEGGS